MIYCPLCFSGFKLEDLLKNHYAISGHNSGIFNTFEYRQMSLDRESKKRELKNRRKGIIHE